MPQSAPTIAPMNRLAEIIARGSCSVCGAGVYMDDSIGRVACKDCEKVTEECTCAGPSPAEMLR